MGDMVRLFMRIPTIIGKKKTNKTQLQVILRPLTMNYLCSHHKSVVKDPETYDCEVFKQNIFLSVRCVPHQTINEQANKDFL